MKLVNKFLLPLLLILSIAFYLLYNKAVSSQDQVVGFFKQSTTELFMEELENRKNSQLNMQNDFLNFAARSVVSLSANYVVNYDKEGLFEELKRYLDIESIKTIAIFDDLTNDYFMIASKKKGKYLQTKKLPFTTNKHFQVIEKPLHYNEEILGLVTLYFDDSNIKNEILNTEKNVVKKIKEHDIELEKIRSKSKKEGILGVIAALLITLGLISALTYKFVINPLNTLKKGLNNFFLFLQNKTNSTDRINLDSHDEFGEMARSLNDNITVSTKLHKKINELNNHLEDKVKEKTKDLQKMVEKFEFATDNVLAGYWEIDLETNKVSFSNGWYKFLGYDKNDMKNISTEDVMEKVIYEEDFKKIKKIVEDYISSPEGYYNVEFRILRKNKEYTWIKSVGYIDKNKFFGLHIDVNDIYKANLQILEQAKLASMGEMIGNIAHQWRQPLSVISTGATGLKIEKEYNTLTDEQFIKTCDAIHSNAQYLSKTIDDFRDFIKGDRKKVKFELNSNIDSFIHLVEGTIKTNDLKVIKEIDEEIILNGYPNELIQCFINIFNNAKDALKDNDKEKYFFISANKQEDEIIIRFKDNAGGIDKDALLHIFEPYFTTKHQSKGTGLGLSMTYNLIVEGMKGSINANNITYTYNDKKYTGAEFKIVLPEI